jgi:septum site-determining protein MinC
MSETGETLKRSLYVTLAGHAPDASYEEVREAVDMLSEGAAVRAAVRADGRADGRVPEPSTIAQLRSLAMLRRPVRVVASIVSMTTPHVATAPEERGALRETLTTSLLLEEPVRSGQSVIFLGGDVTVMGSIASGAEVVAGGSIHVYGAIRGRAMAGANGNPRARIFCRRAEPELLAIDGYYRTSEDINGSLQGRPIQAWLEGDDMKITALD